jgi:hypothetical protein
LVAENTVAVAENASDHNRGLVTDYAAVTSLRGGSFTGRGGDYACGIESEDSGTRLVAEMVTALGEDGDSYNYGLRNTRGATATVRASSAIGRGGTVAYGILNDYDSALEAENVVAVGEDGSLTNCGLLSEDGATATLRGGSYAGRGGSSARGINNYLNTTLEAAGITARGEGGSSSYGLRNSGGSATANVAQSVLDGTTNSVYGDNGSVTVSSSQLIGGAVTGTVTCVAVSHETTFYENSCP